MEGPFSIERVIIGINRKFKTISSNSMMQVSLNEGRCNNITKFTLMEEGDFFRIVTLRVLARHVEQMVPVVINVIPVEQRTNRPN